MYRPQAVTVRRVAERAWGRLARPTGLAARGLDRATPDDERLAVRDDAYRVVAVPDDALVRLVGRIGSADALVSAQSVVAGSVAATLSSESGATMISQPKLLPATSHLACLTAPPSNVNA